VIVIAKHVIAVVSATPKKYGDVTRNSSHGQYGGLFAGVGVSVGSLISFNSQRTI